MFIKNFFATLITMAIFDQANIGKEIDMHFACDDRFSVMRVAELYADGKPKEAEKVRNNLMGLGGKCYWIFARGTIVDFITVEGKVIKVHVVEVEVPSRGVTVWSFMDTI